MGIPATASPPEDNSSHSPSGVSIPPGSLHPMDTMAMGSVRAACSAESCCSDFRSALVVRRRWASSLSTSDEGMYSLQTLRDGPMTDAGVVVPTVVHLVDPRFGC
ncbi:hypothetical protein M4V62_00605 [Streptomyces durmitorensis]|uniref:Uncharacterized protein n=1 Tax=Streptomyces durmitorensis TaxID=319947 RepID=A0ABY4PL52_9ACTN|nr:hypothetical protein M4V62_00605 [Streptomyces durmitorensis]